jgi:hypothetical protein
MSEEDPFETETYRRLAARLNPRAYRLQYASCILRDEAAYLERLLLPFTTGRSQSIPGSNKWVAVRGDTNITRSGIMGMAKDWTLDVERITVICDRVVVGNPVLERTMMGLRYMLRDALPKAWLLGDAGDVVLDKPVELRENQPFWFELLAPNSYNPDWSEIMASSAPPNANLARKCAEITARTLALNGVEAADEAIFDACFTSTTTKFLAEGLANHRPNLTTTKFWVVLEGMGDVVVI